MTWANAEPQNGHYGFPRRRDVLTAGAATVALGMAPASAAEREWTVMIYINGKNNLEPDALANFHAMASVGSTPQVAIVAQLGRPSKHRYTSLDGDWSGVYRFYVEKGTKPLPANGQDVNALGETIDMGSTACLQSFVKWAKSTYPARRYMFVVWNHGQGWRFMLAEDRALRMQAASSRAVAVPKNMPAEALPFVGGYRAVSSDDDSGSILYNKQVQTVVEELFKDRKLDLLGFDACLMSMVETAYAFSPSTDVMVASEELEPAAGWNYEAWLGALVVQPTMGPEALATEVVRAYEKLNGNTYLTTQSAVRLKDVRTTSRRLSQFADILIKGSAGERQMLYDARLSLRSYGDSVNPPMPTSVDLITLLRRFAEKSPSTKEMALELAAAFEAHVVSNYASTRSSGPYGSKGIAIYFPESQRAFKADHYGSGYLKTNKEHPVDFVVHERWPELLYKILNLA